MVGEIVGAVDGVLRVAAPAGVAMLAYIVRKRDSEIEELKGQVKDNALTCASHGKDLSDFRVHVSEHYAKDATVQQSLARLHDRIDDIGSDIKELLKSKK